MTRAGLQRCARIMPVFRRSQCRDSRSREKRNGEKFSAAKIQPRPKRKQRVDISFTLAAVPYSAFAFRISERDSRRFAATNRHDDAGRVQHTVAN